MFREREFSDYNKNERNDKTRWYEASVDVKNLSPDSSDEDFDDLSETSSGETDVIYENNASTTSSEENVVLHENRIENDSDKEGESSAESNDRHCFKQLKRRLSEIEFNFEKLNEGFEGQSDEDKKNGTRLSKDEQSSGKSYKTFPNSCLKSTSSHSARSRKSSVRFKLDESKLQAHSHSEDMAKKSARMEPYPRTRASEKAKGDSNEASHEDVHDDASSTENDNMRLIYSNEPRSFSRPLSVNRTLKKPVPKPEFPPIFKSRALEARKRQIREKLREKYEAKPIQNEEKTAKNKQIPPRPVWRPISPSGSVTSPDLPKLNRPSFKRPVSPVMTIFQDRLKDISRPKSRGEECLSEKTVSRAQARVSSPLKPSPGSKIPILQRPETQKPSSPIRPVSGNSKHNMRTNLTLKSGPHDSLQSSIILNELNSERTKSLKETRQKSSYKPPWERETVKGVKYTKPTSPPGSPRWRT